MDTAVCQQFSGGIVEVAGNRGVAHHREHLGRKPVVDRFAAETVELGDAPGAVGFDLDDLGAVIDRSRAPATSCKPDDRADHQRVDDRQRPQRAAVMNEAPFLVAREVGVEIVRGGQPLAFGAKHDRPVRRLLEQRRLALPQPAQQLGKVGLIDRGEWALMAQQGVKLGRAACPALDDQRENLVNRYRKQRRVRLRRLDELRAQQVHRCNRLDDR